jgi:hypothetical protein
MRRRLLVYGLWALVTPALVGAYAFSGARLTWTSTAAASTPPQPWAFALTGPPSGITSAVALTSYTVAHDHVHTAREAIAYGNRLIASVPTRYRLAGRVGPGRIAVRERDGVFYICARAHVFQGVWRSSRSLVECAAGPLPVRFADVAWTSGPTLGLATSPSRYRAARAADIAHREPSTRTIAALAMDWPSRLGHGRSGTAVDLVLAAALLGVAALALRSPRRRRVRAAWRPALAAAGALVALDIAARVACGPASPRLGIRAGLLHVRLGGAQLHRHISVWGDEGPWVELVVVLAIACAAVVALRRSSPVLMCAAALMLLGILTNLGEVAVRGYDTDYLWFGSAMRTTPFNLGDGYEFCGGLVTAYCCLRAIMAAPRAPALAASSRPGRARPGTAR